MDALCSPDMEHSLVPPSSLKGTVSTACMENLQTVAVAEGLSGTNVQPEASFLLENVQDETQKHTEVAVGALTSASSLDSVSQCPGISPTVGAYTAQCAKCMKWRFIPTKAHFEAIRRSIIERPFFCSSATPWSPHASCNDPFEISPDMHELWAFDKPGIPLPPNGWERLLVIRPAGSVKFADM
ncbi:hypothetical protein L7F22_040601 [Adiantum nelumboides]|nr:hypothetical protein [Adiantum nelumboides]